MSNFFCPEDFFIPNPGVENKLNTDLLAMLMERTQSVVQLLISDDTAGDHNDFSANHDCIMGAIFTLEGQLRQMNQVFQHSHLKT